MVIYILTKFGDDWLIFVDARVLTSKLEGRTEGRTSDGQPDGQRRTVSDHNSSLSTPCLRWAKNMKNKTNNILAGWWIWTLIRSSPLTTQFLLLTLLKHQILDFSKLKEFAGDCFNYDRNGRKLSKWVENTVGTGEISQCFRKLVLQTCKIQGFLGKG